VKEIDYYKWQCPICKVWQEDPGEDAATVCRNKHRVNLFFDSETEIFDIEVLNDD